MAKSRSQVVSSFTVMKGLQLDATLHAFRDWNLTQTKKQNLDRLKSAAPLGRRTANWSRDVAKTLNRRFDTDGVDRLVVELVQASCPLDVWKPIALWHMTRDEFLVRDFLTTWLYPQFTTGVWRLRVDDVVPYLRALPGREGVEVKESWSESTIQRTASGLLRLAVDFGLMAGTKTREFASYHVPDPALLYLLHAARELQPSPHRLLLLPDWAMFLMSPDDLRRELFRLHQFQRVHYEVAGSVGELRLPYATASEYARAELMS